MRVRDLNLRNLQGSFVQRLEDGWADMKVEAKIMAMGVELPKSTPAMGNYLRAVRAANLVFLSGHGPLREDGTPITGKVGADLTIEEGYQAARRVAILSLSSLKAEIGDLDKVRRVVKVLGMVNCMPGFVDQAKVVNGASDLLVEVFGERGRHARSSVGMNALPLNIAVEIEMIVEVDE